MKIRNIAFHIKQAIDSIRYRNYTLEDAGTYVGLLKGKKGLEIGGPSNIFRETGLIPVYPVIGELDGCNFGCNTIWEGKLAEGDNYRFRDGEHGYQYLLDIVDLSPIESNRYEFILCSHVLEHVANPLKALSEMLRVLKKGGILLLLVPTKNNPYDYARQVTPFAHILKDYQDQVKEDDLTHLDEIIKLSLDPSSKDYEKLKQRSLDNYRNRTLHQHVFDARTVKEAIGYFGLDIMSIEEAPPYHIIALAKKL
jgi:SAM-dependent methyltransferase